MFTEAVRTIRELLHELRRAELSAVERMVFLVVFSRAYGQTQSDGSRWGAVLSLQEIARAAGCSRSTVARVLDELEAAGFIERKFRERGAPAVYFIGEGVRHHDASFEIEVTKTSDRN